MIQYRLHISEEILAEKSDEDFLNLAARAMVLNELETEIIRDGVLEALKQIE